MEETARIVGGRNMYFRASHSGAEVDVFIPGASGNIGIEVQYADALGVTKSMRIATEDLNLSRLFVVYPGEHGYDLDARIRVIPLRSLRQELTARRQEPAKKPRKAGRG